MMSTVGGFGPLLLLAAIAGAVASRFSASRGVILAALIAAAAAAIFLPTGVTTAAQFVYAVTGPLSSASLVMLGAYLVYLFWPGKTFPIFIGAPLLAAIVLAIAFPLYAFELSGRGPDLYRLGYEGWALPAALAVLLLVGLWRRAPIVAMWILIGGALYLAKAYESLNLFDYLVDPVAVLLALALAWRRGMTRIGTQAQGMATAR